LAALVAWSGVATPAQEARIESVSLQAGELRIVWRGPAGWTHALERASGLPAAAWAEVASVPRAGEVNEAGLALPLGDRQGGYGVVCSPPSGGPGPRLFFTDLESGPNTGGQVNLGFNAGPLPAWDLNPVNADPRFADLDAGRRSRSRLRPRPEAAPVHQR
jgi:hypothetical protein